MRHPRRRALALALALLIAGPALSGCIGLGGERLIVAASAPKASSGMTVFVVTSGGLSERLGDTRAEYRIYYGEQLVYPPGGKGLEFPIHERTGTVFIPYDRFVVGNGEYDVVITHQGSESRVRVSVQKWAEYVFVRPFDRGDRVHVEVALSSATGAQPQERIFAEGELVLMLFYHGTDGKEKRSLGSLQTMTQNDRTSTTVEIPKSRLNAGPGWYSFEPVFHNKEALNNMQVKADPTMANSQPPANWIHIIR